VIAGAKYWNHRERFHIQTNNATEEQLRKHGVGSWLETCGATAAVNCLAALGWDLTIRCPGPYEPQPEEVLADFLNDPASYPELRKARPDWNPEAAPGNRVADYYPRAVAAVFGARADYIPRVAYSTIVDLICAGHALQLCLMPPGHYIAAVAYDKATAEIIFHDSWPGRRKEWNGDGFARRMIGDEEAAIQPYVVVYREA
jgi:hypothetical protein